MHQSSTIYIGLDVHKASIAAARINKEAYAEAVYLGTVVSWQYAPDTLLRNRHHGGGRAELQCLRSASVASMCCHSCLSCDHVRPVRPVHMAYGLCGS
jgi:hypothetical protein